MFSFPALLAKLSTLKPGHYSDGLSAVHGRCVWPSQLRL